MRSASDKSCRKYQDKHFMFNNLFFEYRVLYEIMWKNIVEAGRPQMTILRMRIACWITKALRICNAYWLFTAKMVTRPRLNITVYIHTLQPVILCIRKEQRLSFNGMLIYWFFYRDGVCLLHGRSRCLYTVFFNCSS